MIAFIVTFLLIGSGNGQDQPYHSPASSATPATTYKTETSAATTETPHTVVTKVSSGIRKTLWWHNMTLYEIYPLSFQDSDGDGMGDLKGITSRLGYLADLGINSIWLSPIFQSPMRDFGYDISNHTAIEPLFGTMNDFDNLMIEAKRLGLRVLLDFVPNHTSNESIWFQRSVANDSEYHDFYVWHPGHSRNKLSVFGGSMWEWSEQRQEYYLHQFLTSQPDLNWRNPKVVEAMNSVMEFWLDKGVDGFRIDVVPCLYEIPIAMMEDANDTERSPYELNSGLSEVSPAPFGSFNLLIVHRADERFRTCSAAQQMKEHSFDHVLQSLDLKKTITRFGCTPLPTINRKLLSSAGDGLLLWKNMPVIMELKRTGDKNISNVIPYFPDDPWHTPSMPFYFALLLNINSSTNGRDIDSLVSRWMDNTPKGAIWSWVMGNHDERRIASKVGNPALVDGFNMINLLLPGIPTTYYGEELGMVNTVLTRNDVRDPAALNFLSISNDPEVWKAKTRDFERSPMHWTPDEPSAGFSTTNNTWLPVSPTFRDGINVQDQQDIRRPHTHLKTFKEVIRLRQKEAFSNGTFHRMKIDEDVYSFLRVGKEEMYLVVIDLRRNGTQKVEHDFREVGLSGEAELVLASVNAYEAGVPTSFSVSRIATRPSEAFVFRVKKFMELPAIGPEKPITI